MMPFLRFQWTTFILISTHVFEGAFQRADETEDNDFMTTPSTLLNCGLGETMVLQAGNPLRPGSYQMMGRMLILNPTAVGTFIFICASTVSRKRLNFSVVPYDYKYKFNSQPDIRPLRDVYEVGDIIHCESKKGYAFSQWLFLWASKDEYVPNFKDYDDKLEIDVNFSASVVFIYICDGRHIRFKVNRETYNVQVKFQKGKPQNSIICSAEGTHVTFIWRTFGRLVQHGIPPGRGNILFLDENAGYRYHQLVCIAVSHTDHAGVKDFQFYHESPNNAPVIHAPKKFYFRHEFIECKSLAQFALCQWRCKRDVDKEIYKRSSSLIKLRKDFFSVFNAKYTCSCEDAAGSTKKAVISFYIRDDNIRQCSSRDNGYFLKIMVILCIILIIVSLAGPLRYYGHLQQSNLRWKLA